MAILFLTPKRIKNAQIGYLRACLHEGGGPQVGGVTRLSI